jgi:hypothetical protein
MMTKNIGLFLLISLSFSSHAAEPDRMELTASLIKAKMPFAALKTLEQVLKVGKDGPQYQRALNEAINLARNTDMELLLSQVLGRVYEQDPTALTLLDADKKQTASYLLANRMLRAGKNKEAQALANTVEPKNAFYARAQYLLALTSLDDQNEAISHFENVRKAIPASVKDAELFDLRNNAILGIARLYYEQAYPLKDQDPKRSVLLKKAVEEYRNVPRFSRAWEHAIFELGWTNSVLENYGDALGAMRSLSHPYFKDAYYPEAEIVSATVYWFNCQWDRANRALKAWNEKYQPMLDKLNSVGTKEGVKDWDDLSQFPALVAEEIKKDPQYKVFKTLITALTQESTRALGPSFSDYYSKGIRDLKKAALAWTRKHVKDLAATLEDIKTRSSIISLETKTAETKWLEEGRQIAGVKRKVLPRPFVPEEKNQFWWAGTESWQDELGWYRLSTKSECYE